MVDSPILTILRRIKDRLDMPHYIDHSWEDVSRDEQAPEAGILAYVQEEGYVVRKVRITVTDLGTYLGPLPQ